MNLDFSSLKPIAEDVTIPGEFFKPPRPGLVQCVLREAGEAAAAEYQAASCEGMEVEHQGTGRGRVMRNLGVTQKTEALLVSLCLWEKNGDGSERLFTQDTVKALPARIVKPIFERAKKISGIDRVERDVDTPWIARARRELAYDNHPERGGDEKVMQGINLTLDWLKKKLADEEDFNPKNLQPAGEGTSALPAS